ncbi:hypothetical protein [Chryseobacterium sp. JK1]|uniref:hypothetical protein n=1 Tax=Chryseobacterium sp. JK1 TaxID=874294 RepID=UPI003D686684
MKKKKIIVPFILLLLTAAALYLVFFHKDKTLKYIPENADVVILLDVKKLTGQYIYSMLTHPSNWSGDSTQNKKSMSLQDSGIRIPDFLQVFHLKSSGYSEWYSVMELKDPLEFLIFLKSQKFVNKGNNHFRKDQLFIVVEGDRCIIGTSDKAFATIKKQLLDSSDNKTWDAEYFIKGSVGSISFISGQRFQNFSIDLKDDEIEIKNDSDSQILNGTNFPIQHRNHFLEMELDAESVKKCAHFFNKSISDSAQINHIVGMVDLEHVNDTIISYSYDDNFNEVEKKTIQKLIQPSYVIGIESKDPERVWEYFQNRKWINAQNQFTLIPFQPNMINRIGKGVVIRSATNLIPLSPRLNENYILIRNSALLLASRKNLDEKEKRVISDIEYILYRNKGMEYSVKVKAKKGEFPLILRW